MVGMSFSLFDFLLFICIASSLIFVCGLFCLVRDELRRHRHEAPLTRYRIR